MFTQSAGAQRGLPTQTNRPALEPLEDRIAAAADAFDGPLPAAPGPSAAAPLEPAAQVGSLPSQSAIVRTVSVDDVGGPVGLEATGLAGADAATDAVVRVQLTGATDVGNPAAFVTVTPLPPEGLRDTRDAVPAALQPAQRQLTEAQAGYRGRVVLPGTGVQARSATGTGPLTQSPGLFLEGGAGEALPPQPRQERTERSLLELFASGDDAREKSAEAEAWGAETQQEGAGTQEADVWQADAPVAP